MAIKAKNILITAGPTWVAIDSVRVISNTASGQTGILLAQKFQQLGAKVTLLLGPVKNCCLSSKIKVVHFKFFEELKSTIIKELKSKKYAILIHSAAVSDYKPARTYAGKLKSGINNLRLNLVPTEKIIDLLRKASPKSFLVGFKYQPQADEKNLINEGLGLMRRAKLDLVVANSNRGRAYQAYILDRINKYGPFLNKIKMADYLCKLTDKKLR